jgi:DNA repair protein RecN (Recombination protein N)
VLEELHIAGLGIIEEATLELAPGLNVLTGETGAGKTMVTVGLGLALGARTAPGLVRRGSGRLAVEARFRPAAASLAEDDDLVSWAEEGELVLARSVSDEGRSGARVGGRLAPMGTLAAIGARLVEVHGQHQAERLASSAAQTEFLDRFAGPEHQATLREHRRVHSELARARADLDALERDAREREREKDLLAYQVREIDAAGIEVGEWETLSAEESRLAHAERLLELTAAAEAAIGEEGGAADRLAASAEAGRAAAALDAAAAALAERLASVAAEAGDALEELRRYRDGLDVDPGRLEEVRQRIQAVRTLERKYGDGEAAILAYGDEARARLLALEDDEGHPRVAGPSDRGAGRRPRGARGRHWGGAADARPTALGRAP